MTPTEFAAWVGGGTAALLGIAKGLALAMKALGLTPEDRRANVSATIASLEATNTRLETDIVQFRERIKGLEEDLRNATQNVDWMERLMSRQGWIKTDSGWERNGPEQRRPEVKP